jgi:glycosyltransferase involved in cell wall biosynthesis
VTEKNITIIQDLDPASISAICNINKALVESLVARGVKAQIISPNAENEINSVEKLRDEIKNSSVVVPILNFTSPLKPLALTACMLASDNGIPFVPFVHTTTTNAKFNLMDGVSDFDQELNLNLIKQVLVNNKCKKIICVSEAVKDSLTNFGVDAEKLKVILNPIATDAIAKINAQLPGQQPEKVVDVIFVARLSKVKGIQLFLFGIKLVIEKMPTLKVVVVGNGSEKDATLSLIKVLGLEKNVKVINQLESTQVLSLVANSKVLVSTSLTESFGLTIAEAMALGVPVVVPNIEGPKELTKSGELGFMFKQCDSCDLAEKILLALADGAEVETMKSNAKNFAIKAFDKNSQLVKLADLILSV